MKKRFLWRAACIAVIAAAAAVLPMAGGQELAMVAQAATADVTFSQPSGVYVSAFSLELSAGAGNTIYYTTDGSNPVSSQTRQQYKTPITVADRKGDANVLSAVDPVEFDSANVGWDSANRKFTSNLTKPANDEVDKITVIKAVAVDGAGKYSSVVTNSYFVGSMTNHIPGIKESCEASGLNLSIMSISMEYDDLFDSEKGIYVHGKIFDEALKKYLGSGNTITSKNAVDVARSLDANYKQKGKDWERAAHIDYFEGSGNDIVCRLQQDCGIRIQGNYSRSDYQKSFRLYAREDYGKKNFKYAFFADSAKNDEGETIDKYKKLNLRNGGNCAFTSKFNDAYWQSLISDLKCETQGSRACVVYLNGEYWGIYIMQEDYDDNYFEETHGVNKDDVVLYKGDAESLALGYKLDEGSLPDGVEDETYYFSDLLAFFNKHKNLSNQKDYEEFCKLVDVESVRDYFAVQVWINNKWDWPGKNWSVWKTTKVDETNPYADGRWRFCFYDLDFGGVSGAGDAGTNTIKEDNYKQYGLLDQNTSNPAVLMYAYLMTNKGFREDFSNSLSSLSLNHFNRNRATAALEVNRKIWEPLLEQFFQRFSHVSTKDDAIYGGYATYAAIKGFLEKRASAIPTMLSWVRNHYNDPETLDAGEYLKAIGTWKKQGGNANALDVLAAEDFSATVEAGDWWIQISDLDLSELEEPTLDIVYEANNDTLQVHADRRSDWTGFGEIVLTSGEERSGYYTVALDKAYAKWYITSDGMNGLKVTQIRIYDAAATIEMPAPGGGGATNPGGGGSTNPGGGDSTNPGGGDSTNPGDGDSTNPGGGDATNPGGSDSTNPGGGDATNPGGDGATNPGGGDATNPGGDGTTNPGGGDATNPGGDGTTNPGATGSGNNGGGTVTQNPNTTQNPGTAVNVKKVTLKKVKPSKKKTVVVQWKKLSGVTGYEVQIATKKNFKKGLKKYTVKKASTAKKTIKKLKSKKKYYVRVRAYKNVSGKKYTGSWSKVKKVKVK